jgi:hypothetical protein
MTPQDRLLNCRKGSVAPTLAIMMIPLMALAGGAVDFARMTASRTIIQDALDTGTMAAAAAASRGVSAVDAERDGTAVFTRTCADAAVCSSLSVSIKVGTVAATGSVSGTTPTVFLGVVGLQSFDIAAKAEVALGGGIKYEDFYYLIDMSDSMSIAADYANREKLKALTKPLVEFADAPKSPNGCEFACHTVIPAFGTKTFYDIARDNGVKLREDVMISAVNTSVDTILAKVTGTHADRFNVGAWAFSDDILELTKLTANSNNVKTKIAKSSITRANTLYDVVMPKYVSLVGEGYDGSTKNKPRKTAIIVTDGVYANQPVDKYGTFDNKYCTQLKSKGVRVVVINVEYQESAGNHYFDKWVSGFYGEINQPLKDCASPGFYYTADEPTELEVTLVKMANDITAGSPYFRR